MCHIFMCTEQDYKSIHQPTNAPHKIQFMTSIQLPHVLAQRCHPQGFFRTKEFEPKTLI
jgi:hypothetical protein